MGRLAVVIVSLSIAAVIVQAGRPAGRYTWYGDSQATTGADKSTGASEVYRPLTVSGSSQGSGSTVTSSSQSTVQSAVPSYSGAPNDAGVNSFLLDAQPHSAGGADLPADVDPFVMDSAPAPAATVPDTKQGGSADVTEVLSSAGGGLGLSFSQESYDLINEILGTTGTNEDDDDSPNIIIEHHHNMQPHEQQQQPQTQQQQQQPQQQEQQPQPHTQDTVFETTDAESVIADILDAGTTHPGTSGTISIATSLDLAFQRYSFAARIFAQAQKKASDAELAVIKARDTVSTAGGEAVAKAVSSSRAEAVKVIRATRAEVRDDVSAARTAYVSAATHVHSKVTEMRAMEKRFRAMVAAFVKVRLVASTALVGLKQIKAAPQAGVLAHLSGYQNPAYARAFEVCKAKVKTMKAVEKQFIAVAKAYAKVRAAAKGCVRDVRKAAFHMAQTCSAATVRVSSAVELATETVSKAITVAKATSMAKAVATVNAVEGDRDDAYDDLRQAGLALGSARESLEAIVAADDSDDDSQNSTSASVGFDNGSSGYGDTPTGHASSFSAPDVAVGSSTAMGTASSSDKTDTMASY